MKSAQWAETPISETFGNILMNINAKIVVEGSLEAY